jgi:very-short-patch-repair endonuclease
LRSEATDAEKLLWSKLRRHQIEGLQFRRQSPIGRYIVDFVSPAAKLIVKVDGGQHTAERDAACTAWLEGQGFRVLRFWNHEVLKNIEGVLKVIANATTPPLPSPPPQGGRE